MFKVHSPKGTVIARYKDFRCLRTMINGHKAKLVTLTRHGRDEAVVVVVLENDAIFSHIFTLRRARKVLGGWRSLYGTPLIVDRRHKGTLRKWHPDLTVHGRQI